MVRAYASTSALPVPRYLAGNWYHGVSKAGREAMTTKPSRVPQAPPRSRFLRACWRLPVDKTPVWYMRQAGRYQPQYRAWREGRSFQETLEDPELAARITTLPVAELGVDAAILYSDITVVLGPMGVDYTIQEGIGPVVFHPVARREDVASLRVPDPKRHLAYVLRTVSRVRELLPHIPLIGFAGGPFTLASYLVEGRPTRTYARTKALMYADPALFDNLLQILARAAAELLRAQVEAGAQAVQIFDSWVGALSPQDYREFVLPHVHSLMAELEDLGVPRILFGVGTGELLRDMASTGAEVVGVDWRVPLSHARERVGDGTALMGNLDPVTLLAPWPVLRERAQGVRQEGEKAPGYVFNLGHGVLPETDPRQLARLTAYLHGEEG
jgi:uroporphyrinogen decarboxylase